MHGHQRPGYRSSYVNTILALALPRPHLFPQFANRILSRAIQHYPQRTVVRVVDHQHDRPHKVRVEQVRRCH